MKAIQHLLSYLGTDQDDEGYTFYQVELLMDVGTVRKGTRFDEAKINSDFVLTLINYTDHRFESIRIQLVFMPTGLIED